MVPVTVIIRDETGAETERRHIDHDNREHRQWQGKAAFWAMRHHHTMESAPGWLGIATHAFRADT